MKSKLKSSWPVSFILNNIKTFAHSLSFIYMQEFIHCVGNINIMIILGYDISFTFNNKDFLNNFLPKSIPENIDPIEFIWCYTNRVLKISW